MAAESGMRLRGTSLAIGTLEAGKIRWSSWSTIVRCIQWETLGKFKQTLSIPGIAIRREFYTPEVKSREIRNVLDEVGCRKRELLGQQIVANVKSDI
jgi:hypothetical protein